MSSDLIAWVVGIVLGVAVIGLGLRRSLADVTQSWLPRFDEGPGSATATLESFDGGQGRRQLSPRERRFALWFYPLLSACNAVFAVLSTDKWVGYAIIAVLFALVALAVRLEWGPYSSKRAAS